MVWAIQLHPARAAPQAEHTRTHWRKGTQQGGRVDQALTGEISLSCPIYHQTTTSQKRLNQIFSNESTPLDAHSDDISLSCPIYQPQKAYVGGFP